MKIRIAAMLLTLIMLSGFTSCTARSGADVEKDVPGTHVFTDDCGRDVNIPDRITSIAASGTVSQIILLAIAPEMLVGLASDFDDTAMGFIPDEYFELPYFGQLYGSADLNVEELAAAGPQLILDVGEAKKSVAEDMAALETQTNIPSVHIEASLATMPEAFRKLGNILGKEEKGETLARFCEKVYDRTISVMEQVGNNKADALYILGEKGLNVLAKGSYHAELVDLLTNNAAIVDSPAGKGSGNEVTMEQIAIWDPDVILFAPGSVYDTVDGQEIWKELTAIQNGNYAEVPVGPYNWMAPPAVQRYLGLIWLTAVLYPEYCDYDVKTEVKEYYDLFYGCDMTDEQYDALTRNAFMMK